MKNIKTIFNLIILSIILLFQSNTLMAQENKQDTVKSKMFNNAIYGSVGTLGFYYHVGIYYERMFQKNSPKSKISTFVKVGYGGAVTWDASNQFFSGQYGILTGIKKHHFEGSLGLATYFGDDGENMLGMPLTGSVGYRIQKPNGHFIFRTGVGWPEGLYLGLGLSF